MIYFSTFALFDHLTSKKYWQTQCCYVICNIVPIFSLFLFQFFSFLSSHYQTPLFSICAYRTTPYIEVYVYTCNAFQLKFSTKKYTTLSVSFFSFWKYVICINMWTNWKTIIKGEIRTIARILLMYKIDSENLSMNTSVPYKVINVSALNVYSHISVGLYIWILCVIHIT